MQPLLVSSLLLLAASSHAAPTADGPTVKVAKFQGPLTDDIFGDPSVLKVGSTLYAFATNHYDRDQVNVPMQKSNDGLYSGWSPINGDALPDPGDWTYKDGGDAGVWNPDVSQLDDGRFIMYYSAHSKDAPNNARCIGYAHAPASSPTGPYNPGPSSIICDGSAGAIGVDGITDPVTGNRYILWKNGSFVGSVKDGFPTIALQRVSASDGFTLMGKPQALVHPPPGANGYESPALTRMPDNRWLLLHTTGTWQEDYEVHYQIGTEDIFGDYAPRGVLFTSGDKSGDTTAVNPGGPDFVGNSNTDFVWAGLTSKGSSKRNLYAGTLAYGNQGQVKLV